MGFCTIYAFWEETILTCAAILQTPTVLPYGWLRPLPMKDWIQSRQEQNGNLMHGNRVNPLFRFTHIGRSER